MKISSEVGAEGVPQHEINMVPLIDVMLVLLIIFMITAPLVTRAVEVDLPRAAAPVQERPAVVALSIDAAGGLHWNGAALADAELADRLSAAAATTPQPELHLRADRATPYERVARTLAAARAAGLERIGFVMLPEG
ncbi:biopolymer transporter ExbD [Pseudothauera nasutitermitis]|uniref:Biopolymer transporter ExbD n=1 Tax=Pseudothauera nasutitermitis TaxID=2565930 RepID=A0A4S4B4N8_9RHOO|nr:biopolymer transporter ExbD [Pseudothauera nasutitermitis]THF67261.1 biopolymer transporter ExbD [Pseudothauera nasutitermitis]